MKKFIFIILFILTGCSTISSNKDDKEPYIEDNGAKRREIMQELGYKNSRNSAQYVPTIVVPVLWYSW